MPIKNSKSFSSEKIYGDWSKSDLNLIVKPKITSPKNGEVNFQGSIIASKFKANDLTYKGTLNSVEFQIAKDRNFKVDVQNKTSSSETLSSWDISANTNYFARVRFISGDFKSSWSDIVRFTSGGIYIKNPVVSLSLNSNSLVSSTYLTITSFSNFEINGGSSADTFKNASVNIYDATGSNKLFSGTVNNIKSSHTITYSLKKSTNYKLGVKYNGNSLQSVETVIDFRTSDSLGVKLDNNNSFIKRSDGTNPFLYFALRQDQSEILKNIASKQSSKARIAIRDNIKKYIAQKLSSSSDEDYINTKVSNINEFMESFAVTSEEVLSQFKSEVLSESIFERILSNVKSNLLDRISDSEIVTMFNSYIKEDLKKVMTIEVDDYYKTITFIIKDTTGNTVILESLEINLLENDLITWSPNNSVLYNLKPNTQYQFVADELAITEVFTSGKVIQNFRPDDVEFGAWIIPSNTVPNNNIQKKVSFDTIGHNNFHNYEYRNGNNYADLVFIPTLYYRYSEVAKKPYAGYKVELSPEPLAGFVVHREFINANSIIQGVLLMKHSFANMTRSSSSRVSTLQSTDGAYVISSHTGYHGLNNNDDYANFANSFGMCPVSLQIWKVLEDIMQFTFQSVYNKFNGDFSRIKNLIPWAETNIWEPYQGTYNSNGNELNGRGSFSYSYSGNSSYNDNVGAPRGKAMSYVTFSGKNSGVDSSMPYNINFYASFSNANGRLKLVKTSVNKASIATTASNTWNSNFETVTAPNTGSVYLRSGECPFKMPESQDDEIARLNAMGIPSKKIKNTSSTTDFRYGRNTKYIWAGSSTNSSVGNTYVIHTGCSTTGVYYYGVFSRWASDYFSNNSHYLSSRGAIYVS